MHPVFLRIGGFAIYTHGVMTALAFLAGIWLALRYAREDGLDTDQLNELFIYILISSIVGARLFSVFFDGEFPWYISHPMEIFKIWQGGLVYYGGFIFAVFTSLVFLRVRDMPVWTTGDALAPGISLGQVIGRMGCFAAADSWGKATHVPWAVTYTDPEALAPLNVPLHPTELYMVLGNLLVLCALIWLRKRKRFDGQVFLAYGLLYPIQRFVIEFYRDDPRGMWFNNALSTAQLISLFLFALSLVFFFLKRKDVPRKRAQLVAH
ncbi:MAG TPA: prolipoprotein diacylglyceryl transferase [Acidobacteriota bacterium]|jgi:phosphatidylglycerol:prolipoprotein diacylglycerol transferase|nr:prolipoprotein diacylglyceryl transferase [Acidobacteriota bacterium]